MSEARPQSEGQWRSRCPAFSVPPHRLSGSRPSPASAFEKKETVRQSSQGQTVCPARQARLQNKARTAQAPGYRHRKESRPPALPLSCMKFP